MTTSLPQQSDALAAVIRWRRLAIGWAVAFCLCFVLLASVVLLSLLELNDRHNLYYLLWKAGIRRYDAPIALDGLIHDDHFHRGLIGISTEAFLRQFPNTFHKVHSRQHDLTSNQVLYIDDYRKATQESGSVCNCWHAVFEDDQLVSFEFCKG